MATGPFQTGPGWTRKMRTLFRRLDLNGQGYLMSDDIINVATSIFNVFPKMQQFQQDGLVNCLVNFWFGVLAAHVERKRGTRATIKEFLFVENLGKGLSGEFGAQIEDKFLNPMFEAMDQDNDGLITNHEFEALMTGWRAVVGDANALYHAFATDGGKMSKKSFCELMTDYFMGNNEKSKTSKLWGPLLAYKRAEDYGELDCGPVWEGKIRNMFRRFDYNETMKLRCSNFLTVAQSLIHRGRLDKKKSDAVIRNMMHLWVKFIGIDKDGNHLEEIREIEFIHNMRAMINGEFRHEIDQFGWTFFKAMETDNSGFITATAFRTLQEIWQVGREEAEGMFKVIDTNKDNKISSDEFLTAWNEYCLSEDKKSPYKMFFGPIISRQLEAR